MHRILEAEIHYTLWGVISMFMVIPVFFVYLGWNEAENIDFLLWLAPYIILNMFIPLRIKEKRDTRLALLPLSVFQIGMIRILLLWIPLLAFMISLFFINRLLFPQVIYNYRAQIISMAILIIIYAAYFILHDYLSFSRLTQGNLKRIRTGLISGLIVLLVFFIFLGIYAASNQPPWIKEVFLVIKAINQIAGSWAGFIFIIISLFFSGMSLLTFGRRKSYLD